MAESVDSSVGFDARISSASTRDSSTFCKRTRANAFNDYKLLYEPQTEHTCIPTRTLTKSFCGSFLSSLLHATIADLFDPVSMASTIHTV